jgi:hypothetical protein
MRHMIFHSFLIKKPIMYFQLHILIQKDDVATFDTLLQPLQNHCYDPNVGYILCYALLLLIPYLH